MSRHGSGSVGAQIMLQSLDDLRDSMQDIDTHLQANHGDCALMEMVNLQRKSIVTFDTSYSDRQRRNPEPTFTQTVVGIQMHD